MTKKIVAEMRDDWVEPYARQGYKIPVVIESNLPQYPVGMRLDWGFVQSVVGDGYEVTILPHRINRRTCNHPDGFEWTGFLTSSRGKNYRIYHCNTCSMHKYMLKKEDEPMNLPADTNWDYEG